MKVETINLYEYFNIEAPKNAKGLLTVYALDNNVEIGFKRERSAMLVLPGGGYRFVSFREGESIAISYLKHGIQAFVLDYSIADEFRYPTQLREAAMAMIFIRENAKKYHVKPESVGAIGFSAGGHLCGCLANLYNSAVLSDLRNCDFIRPSAVILSYPVSVYGGAGLSHEDSFVALTNNNEELSKELSLENTVTKLSPPAFLWHTVDDDVVPVVGTLILAKKYHELNVPIEMHLFESGAHGLSVATSEVNTPNEAVAKWFDLSITWLKSRGFIVYS